MGKGGWSERSLTKGGLREGRMPGSRRNDGMLLNGVRKQGKDRSRQKYAGTRGGARKGVAPLWRWRVMAGGMRGAVQTRW